MSGEKASVVLLTIGLVGIAIELAFPKFSRDVVWGPWMASVEPSRRTRLACCAASILAGLGLMGAFPGYWTGIVIALVVVAGVGLFVHDLANVAVEQKLRDAEMARPRAPRRPEGIPERRRRPKRRRRKG